MKNSIPLFESITTEIFDGTGSNYIKTRFYLDKFPLEEKIVFITSFLKSQKVKVFYLKVLFWDSLFEDVIKNMFDSNSIQVESSYNGSEVSGLCYLKTNDEKIFKTLLLNHFNFELGHEPSFNVKIYLLNLEETSFSFINFYDDRGFDVYWKK